MPTKAEPTPSRPQWRELAHIERMNAKGHLARGGREVVMRALERHAWVKYAKNEPATVPPTFGYELTDARRLALARAWKKYLKHLGEPTE